MELIKMFPELGQKTIWANMPVWASRVIWSTINSEREFGRPLPADSFYKSLAIRQIKKAQVEFIQKVSA